MLHHRQVGRQLIHGEGAPPLDSGFHHLHHHGLWGRQGILLIRFLSQLQGDQGGRAMGRRGAERRGAILHPPGRGEIDHEAQAAVIVATVHEHPVRGWRAPGEAFQQGKERALRGRALWRHAFRRAGLNHFIEPAVISRVGGEEPVIAHAAPLHLPGKFLLVRQHPNDFEHGDGVIAGVGEVAGPQAIGLKLLIPAVAAQGRLAVGSRRLIERTAPGQKTEEGGAKAGTATGKLALLRMASHQVADLVAENGRQLGFVLEVGQEAPGNKDVSSVHGEGVDRGVVQHGKGIAIRILPGRPKHALAHLRHVVREGAAVHRALLLELGQGLFPIGARPGARGEPKEHDNEHPEDPRQGTTMGRSMTYERRHGPSLGFPSELTLNPQARPPRGRGRP